MPEFASNVELSREPEIDKNSIDDQNTQLALDGIARITELAEQINSIEVTAEPFGTQLMEVSEDFENLIVASSGPTMSGGMVKNPDDPGGTDTGPGKEN